MFIIGEIEVHESVTETKFACDLDQCKGACCTFAGGRGAPLTDDEVAHIEKNFPVIEHDLPPAHLAVIRRSGLVDGTAGNFATQCVDGKACVFVYFDGEIAKCAFEKAFREQRIDWQKPLSCHLFPVRMKRGNPSETEIHYEYFSECEPALKKGNDDNIMLHTFVSKPLQRVFGDGWTAELNDTINAQQS